MNNKKIIKILISAIVMLSIVVSIGINNNKELEANSNEYIKNLKPISKANAIKILKAEYGDIVSIPENQIKRVGDKYLIQVYLNVEDEEEHGNEEEYDTSLGIHKINVFTGELILPD